MRIAILHNADHDLLEDDPGREARRDIERVAAAMTESLRRGGLSAERLAVDHFTLANVLDPRRYDLVVNLCESLAADSRGEMAVPCLLELLGVPFTGSPALALGLALHKDKAKELLVARGVPTPEFKLVDSAAVASTLELPFPLIVKPAREDASVGIDFDSVVHNRAQLVRAVNTVLKTFRQPALVERFIDGREIYVPILGNRPRRTLPLSEIAWGPTYDDKPRVVGYRAKWELDSPECIDSSPVPCTLPKEQQQAVVKAAIDAFEALGCRDYGRVDVRLSNDGTPYVIDVNPNCDLHPDAGFARAAKAAGMDYDTLALELVEIALGRSHGHSTSRRGASGATGRAAGSNRNLFTGRSGVRARAHRPRAHSKPS